MKKNTTKPTIASPAPATKSTPAKPVAKKKPAAAAAKKSAPAAEPVVTKPAPVAVAPAAPAPVVTKPAPKPAPVAAPKPAPVAAPAIVPAPKPVPVPAPVAVKLVERKPVQTTISARIDIGFGNRLFIRGDGPGLSWDAGVAMECVADDLWKISLGEFPRGIIFKFLVNDLTWNVGPDYTVTAGETVTLIPEF